MTTILEQYQRLCDTPSDIHEHLPTLKKYAEECDHVTELGVRFAVSTWAFLAGKPKKFVCVDYMHDHTALPRQLAEEAGIEFEFYLKSTIDPTFVLEPTDLLFIDTWHAYEQLSAELAMHHSKAKKYIIMHDTTLFGDRGEGDTTNPIYQSRKGLWVAITEFMNKHPEWQLVERYTNNNGLTVLKRTEEGFKMNPIEMTIELDGDWTTEESARLKEAYEFALTDESTINPYLKTMEGMSGFRYRYLINKLVEITPDPRYLEIGSWSGSTACSVINNNKCKALCIDNWSHFGGPKDAFMHNTEFFGNDDVDFYYIESNYEDVDYSQIGKYNIYLFDGPHEEHHQNAGVTMTQDALDDTYTLIVDDWNWVGVRDGTLNGLKELGQTIVASITIRTTQNEIHPSLSGFESEWHNGYFIAVIKK
jgi:predicted O-methyltransferase YrrM